MNSRHPDHPRYCSRERWADIKRLCPLVPRTTLPCKQLVFNNLGAVTGVRFHTGARANVAGDQYHVAPTRRREMKDWITTGARIERAHRA
jgi:hypothetical protein